MSLKYAKIIVLKSDVPGTVPTIPVASDHDKSAWRQETDIYEGELFLNTADQVLYTRCGNDIVQLSGDAFAQTVVSLSDVDVSSYPGLQDGDVLAYDSATGTFVPTHSGIQGTSGYSGYSGVSGASGASGAAGLSGYSGASGAVGAVGLIGLSGASGASGKSGYSGVSGASGKSGVSGKSGYSGLSGKSGYSGLSGASGWSGASGFSGKSGYSGTSGASGKSGYSGTSGTFGKSGVSAENSYIINNTFQGDFFYVTDGEPFYIGPTSHSVTDSEYTKLHVPYDSIIRTIGLFIYPYVGVDIWSGLIDIYLEVINGTNFTNTLHYLGLLKYNSVDVNYIHYMGLSIAVGVNDRIRLKLIPTVKYTTGTQLVSAMQSVIEFGL